MEYGLIKKPVNPQEWLVGSYSPKKYDVICAESNWRKYLPVEEVQRFKGLETMSCVSQASNNCLEMLFKVIYGIDIRGYRYLQLDYFQWGRHLSKITGPRIGPCP
jgi:hypothetical protein